MYEIEVDRVQKAVLETRYISRQNGEERGLEKHHCDAIMKAITPTLLDIFRDIWNDGADYGW